MTGSAGARSRRAPDATRFEGLATTEAAAAPGRGGLGLTIAHAFVAAHGRTLVLDDNPGGGACFSFALPATPVDEGYVGAERDSVSRRAHPPAPRTEADAEAEAEAVVCDEPPDASSARLGASTGARQSGTATAAPGTGST